MSEYTAADRKKARIVLGITDSNGRRLKMQDMTKEALIDRMLTQGENHMDRIHELNGSIDALKKRLKDHRKAKALANRRADDAVSVMRTMLNTFEAKDGT